MHLNVIKTNVMLTPLALLWSCIRPQMTNPAVAGLCRYYELITACGGVLLRSLTGLNLTMRLLLALALLR